MHRPRMAVGACVAALLWLGGVASAADTRLVDAIKAQDKAGVRALLRQQVDVNAPQGDGATALHWAANRNDVEIAGLLIKAGAKIDAANDYGVTPLSLACENGSAEMAGLLLKAGADPNLTLPTGETALMTASRTGNLATVLLLLGKGAHVDATEPTELQTALIWALSEQHVPVARALVEHGADVNRATSSGFTPLMMAARFGNYEAAGLLLANGARINDTAKDGISVLMVAVMRGHAKFAEFLLGVGADANIDTAGYTALHWAAGKWESIQTHDYPDPRDAEWAYLGGVPAGRLELILALLAHGADINARMTKGAPRYGMSLNFTQLPGATPFWLAAYATDLEVMGLLLANGADPTIPLRNGTTAVMAAAGLGREPGGSLITDEQSVPAVGLCLDLGIDVNAATTAGDTALHGTAYYGNEKVAQLLVARGADVNPKNKKGETPTKVADGYIQAAMVYTRPGVAAALRKLGGKTD